MASPRADPRPGTAPAALGSFDFPAGVLVGGCCRRPDTLAAADAPGA